MIDVFLIHIYISFCDELMVRVMRVDRFDPCINVWYDMLSINMTRQTTRAESFVQVEWMTQRSNEMLRYKR